MSPVHFRRSYFQRGRGEKHTMFYCMPNEHLGKAIFEISCVLVWSKLSASQLMGKLCFCFVLTYIKLVDTVWGKQEVREAYSCVWEMRQQEPLAASREAESLSDVALVVISLLGKLGFVWILQYTHCSGPFWVS